LQIHPYRMRGGYHSDLLRRGIGAGRTSTARCRQTKKRHQP